MAKSLNSCYWVKEPLNEEVPYNSGDIIVENSDIDKSPRARAERNRRRKAIGKRYLLGHVPLIQTASLRGPFDGKNGWIAPWGRNRACLNNKKPSRSTRNHFEDTKRLGEIDAESEALAAEKSAGAPTQEELLDRRIDDDAVRYDADNEDDAFEEVNDEERDLLHRLEHLDGTQMRHIHLSRGEPQSKNSDDDLWDASERDLKQVIKHQGSRDEMRARNGLLPNERKRKVDTGWLRGANVLKRSRNELFEHSSPTPIAARREGHRGLQSGSCRQTSDSELSDVQENTQVLPIPHNCNRTAQFEATGEASALPAAVGSYDEISFDAVKDSTEAFLMPNGQIVAANYECLTHSDLGQQNANGQLHVSHEPILTQFLKKGQVDVVQLSPSKVEVVNFGSLSSARRLSRQERASSLKDAGKVSEKLFYGYSATSDTIAYEDMDGEVGFRETPSPVSEESFSYRKTSRKSLEGKSGPYAEEGDERASAAGKSFGTPEREARPLKPIDALPLHSSDLMSSGNARGFKIQENVTRIYIEKGFRHHHRTKSPISNLDSFTELDIISSPDPLSEDFKDSQQLRITPDMHQRQEQNPVNLAHVDIVAVDCHRIIVAQISPASQQQAAVPPQSALRDISQMSTSSISDDHMESSMNFKGSLQRQLANSPPKQSVLPAKAEDIDEGTLVQGYHSDGRLSSQLESPEVNNTSKSLPHALQQPDILAAQPVSFKDNTEASLPLDLSQRVGSSSDNTPTHIDAQVLEQLARSTQSPWTAISLESLRSDLSLEPGSNDSEHKVDNNYARRYLELLPKDETVSAALSAKAEGQTVIDVEDRDEADTFEPFKSLFKHSGQFLDELGQSPPRFPSTQTLVNATTTNPWNSAFKKSRRRISEKRVSFGPMPSEPGEAASETPSKPLRRMESPPPPAGTLRLTQLDDPFHHRLKATRDLEVTEESLTRFMNTPWDDIPATKPRAQPPSSSPPVAAMAEAFIAADKQCLHEKLDIKDRPRSTSTKPTELVIQPRIWAEHENTELGNSSPPDASFSIAPSGRVTAVSIEAQHYDAEDNLHAVIEDMGSFLEGWDLESELKKAKGHKFGRGHDFKAPRKREYLSGISNR